MADRIPREEVTINVPEDTHVNISHFSGAPLDLVDLVCSHLLVFIMNTFGVDAKFTWKKPRDWQMFARGEKVLVEVSKWTSDEYNKLDMHKICDAYVQLQRSNRVTITRPPEPQSFIPEAVLEER